MVPKERSPFGTDLGIFLDPDDILLSESQLRSRQGQQARLFSAGSGDHTGCSIIISGWNRPILAAPHYSFR
jgi:hypothetical protein